MDMRYSLCIIARYELEPQKRSEENESSLACLNICYEILVVILIADAAAAAADIPTLPTLILAIILIEGKGSHLPRSLASY